MELIPQDIVDTLNEHDYSVIRPLGKGGFADCYLVLSKKYQIEFACKIFSISDVIGSVKQRSFETEFHVLTHLNHPSIIKVYNVFSNEQRLYLILEYCQNGDLQQYINKNGPVTSQKDLLRILKMMLSSLEYLEDQNIAHKDIKPANFLIDKNFRIKLTDFGLTKMLANVDDLSQDFTGSLPFLPPEVINNQPYNPLKADVWSFGITIYYLASGKLPFTLTSAQALKQAIQLGNIVFPMNMPKIARTLLLRCLDVNPNKRITFHELKDIVESALDAYPSHPMTIKSNVVSSLSCQIVVPNTQRHMRRAIKKPPTVKSSLF